MQITERNQKSVHHVITKIGQTNLGLAEQIHNRIKILAGFDSGTKPTILGKQKPVLLADALYNQALRPIKMDRRCLN